MEDSLKHTLKRMKANESLISMILGGLVIVVIGMVLIDYFQEPDSRSQITSESASTISQDVNIDQLDAELLADESAPEASDETPVVIAQKKVVQVEIEKTPLELNIDDDSANNLRFGDLMEDEATVTGEISTEKTEKVEKLATTAVILKTLKGLFDLNEQDAAETSPSAEIAYDPSIEELAITEDIQAKTVETQEQPEPNSDTHLESQAIQDVEEENESDETEPEVDASEEDLDSGLLDKIITFFRKEKAPNDTDDAAQEDTDLDNSPQLPQLHTVAEGEHLWQIAQKYYESGFNWVDIAAINGLGDGNLIAAGQKISIPDVPVRTGDSSEPIRNLGGKQTVEVSATITGKTHTVAEGETLWQISMSIYGDGLQWPTLYDANDDILSSPDVIEVGQTIRIPDSSQ